MPAERPLYPTTTGQRRGGRSTVFFIGLVSLCSATWACATPQISLDKKPREYVATDYIEVLRRWTRTEQLISVNELDDVLTATATYESWDFRWAYVVRYAEDYRLTVDQRSEMLDRSLNETNETHQFYVAVYAKKPKWGDLTRENAAWIVRLVDNRGNETAPAEIELIKKPGAIEQTYFPYTSPWRTVHRIRFPVHREDGTRSIAHNARWFGLRFAGAQGHKQLVWSLDGTRAAPE